MRWFGWASRGQLDGGAAGRRGAASCAAARRGPPHATRGARDVRLPEPALDERVAKRLGESWGRRTCCKDRLTRVSRAAWTELIRTLVRLRSGRRIGCARRGGAPGQRGGVWRRFLGICSDEGVAVVR